MRKIHFKRVIATLACLFFGIGLFPALPAKAAANVDLQACSQVFDCNYYAAMYPDVAASENGSPLGLLNHYIYFGINEGRNPSASFNATDYMLKNPDLKAVYGDNLLAYVHHYVSAGKAEGRDATPSVGAELAAPQSYTLLGTYATEYDAAAARAKNIALASSFVNGTVVAPGGTFSATRAIGPRSVSRGYVEAPVFINKQHSKGIGGGVCQVSSTIYAASKMAGIKASERHPHSLPVNYLPPGWDATISGSSLDMKFKNPYNKNLIVYITANNGVLTAALYLQN